MAKKVYIGVGHGGADAGAVANGFYEKNLNLDVAKACQAALKRSGVSVKISRTKDITSSIAEKVAAANAWGADVALDIHHNAGGGDGAEVYYTINGGTGKTLAENILAGIKEVGQNSRGAKIKKNASGTDYFGFIRDTAMPAVLVECAFMDSNDIKIVDTAAERVKMGEAIAKGVCKTVGVKYKVAQTETETKPTTNTESDKIYRVQTGAFRDVNNALALQKKLKAAGFDAIIV